MSVGVEQAMWMKRLPWPVPWWSAVAFHALSWICWWMVSCSCQVGFLGFSGRVPGKGFQGAASTAEDEGVLGETAGDGLRLAEIATVLAEDLAPQFIERDLAGPQDRQAL